MIPISVATWASSSTRRVNTMAFNVNALGFGDNVDRYEHIHTMYPGGNAVNPLPFMPRNAVPHAPHTWAFWQ